MYLHRRIHSVLSSSFTLSFHRSLTADQSPFNIRHDILLLSLNFQILQCILPFFPIQYRNCIQFEYKMLFSFSFSCRSVISVHSDYFVHVLFKKILQILFWFYVLKYITKHMIRILLLIYFGFHKTVFSWLPQFIS